jgi:hypothetical protein
MSSVMHLLLLGGSVDHTIDLAVAKAFMVGCIKQLEDDEDEDNEDKDEDEDEKTMNQLSRSYLEIGMVNKRSIIVDRTFDSFYVDNMDFFVALSRLNICICFYFNAMRGTLRVGIK